MIEIPVCPYCKNTPVKTTGESIYPHRPDLYSKIFYQCLPCSAYVGCHPGTDRPMGAPANKELRKARNDAHFYFDMLWRPAQPVYLKDGQRSQTKFNRSKAYKWISEKLGYQVHIGESDLETCHKIITLCKELVWQDDYNEA